MVDFEQINKVNKLAKALKESGMAATMDDAVNMAQEMVAKGEESIAELSEKPPSAEELVKEKFKEGPINKAKDVIKTVGEVLHIKKKEAGKPFKMSTTTELIEKAEKEKVGKLKERAKELKEEMEEKGEEEEIEEVEEKEHEEE